MRIWGILAGGVLILAAVLATRGQSPTQQVEAKVQEFAHAVARRDYGTICGDVLARPLAVRLSTYGAPCAQTLRVALRRVHDPVVSVGKVNIEGRRASAITLTVARGQRAMLRVMKLLDTSRGWRITSLASPVTQTAAG